MSGASNPAYVEEIAKAYDRDRWVAALYAPEDKRPYLHALIAFDHELVRLRAKVREPMAGEMRLAWWREALTGDRAAEARGNPIAALLIDASERFQFPSNLIEHAIAAHQFDLYDDPVPSMNDLEGYCGETCSALFQLAALILGNGDAPGATEASGLAGVAYGVTALLRVLPAWSARGQCYAPREVLQRCGATPADVRARHPTPGVAAALREMIALARRRLAEAEAGVAALPRDIVPAFVPLAVVPLWLGELERAADAPFDREVEVASWRRQWALWRWAQRR